jgi:hypothetical protein
MKKLEDIFDAVLNINVRKQEDKYIPNKPLLVLAAIERCMKKHERLAKLEVYENCVKEKDGRFKTINLIYPFGRLHTDSIWELKSKNPIIRNSSGDLVKSDLEANAVVGGFPDWIYTPLIQDKSFAQTLLTEVIYKFFESNHHEYLKSIFSFSNEIDGKLIMDAGIGFQKNRTIHSKQKLKNNFIFYLNSLHNLTAGGANALAESQATNPFFAEIYEPFPIVKKIIDLLSSEKDRVIILTGHAGDGKSTIALDVFKFYKKLDIKKPLNKPLAKWEKIDNINILKDMSESSSANRQKYLFEAFEENGNWLIVSNTGPLLNSLIEYGKSINIKQDIESQILDVLDRPFSLNIKHHSINLFNKELIILNLTRIDNVHIGAKILTRLIQHSAWSGCSNCEYKSVCPIQRNRNALIESGSVAEERVRWIYHRLHAYEQRLTLRQIVAHLAFSITGNTDCSDVHQHTLPNQTQEDQQSHQALGKIIFSETFFGFQAGKPYEPAERLRAIALIRRSTFGAPIGVDFERKLLREPGLGWGTLPSTLIPLSENWQQEAIASVGVRWRFGLRRLNYLFAKINSKFQKSADIFLDTFLQSPQLRNFDQWQLSANNNLPSIQSRYLRNICLRVLLEIFSGFSAQQFNKSSSSNLYITLRRPNQAVVQTTQIIVCTIPFKSFAVDFDAQKCIPVLSYEKGKVVLPLSLPLLDYIYNRHDGSLGNELSRIHQTQLAAFRANLVRASQSNENYNTEIELLRMGINGEAQVHSFFINEANNTLEKLEY